MKKGLLLLIAILLCTGCEALIRNRSVKNNIFESKKPEMLLVINPRFEYLGYHETITRQTSAARDRVRNKKVTAYVFITKAKDSNAINELVAITFHQTNYSGHSGELFQHIQQVYDKGAVELGGQLYQYYTRFEKPSANMIFTQFVLQEGFEMTCGLVKRAARAVGPHKTELMNIYYYQSVTNTDIACDSWQIQQRLNTKQKDFLRTFDQTFHALMNFIE